MGVFQSAQEQQDSHPISGIGVISSGLVVDCPKGCVLPFFQCFCERKNFSSDFFMHAMGGCSGLVIMTRNLYQCQIFWVLEPDFYLIIPGPGGISLTFSSLIQVSARLDTQFICPLLYVLSGAELRSGQHHSVFSPVPPALLFLFIKCSELWHSLL